MTSFGANNFDKDLINDISNMVNKHIEDDSLPEPFINAAKAAGESIRDNVAPEDIGKHLNTAMYKAAEEHGVQLNNINMTKFQRIAKGE